MDLSKAFLDFAQLGAGWVLWLLVALSVISIGVMIDRVLWFRSREADTERFNQELRGAYLRGELERFIAKHRADPGIPIQVALRGLADRDQGPEAVAEAMHGERAKWRRAGDRNLMVLGTLGNNVPFVGLFGTVLGVMNAFLLLSSKSATAEKETFDQIAEALSATAFALLVAIPAVAAFNYFTRRLRVLMTSADECAHQVLSLVHGELHTGTPGRPTPGTPATPAAPGKEGTADGG
ncbi:MAG: MotA/TolQ/ExbB proton channel family protein [Deltaproteobacteria bacterium]|nr:MotA/TolQ/ExbB proton channel family protein [Deltaproteobacteria bacterium]MDQ3301203.1 MotA/TolQ/ExbB proton channel family protein [Myxococcota bacterium]